MKIKEKKYASTQYLAEIESWWNWFQSDDDLRVHSSGTTGEAKEIRIKREYVMNSAQASVDFFGLNHNSEILLVLPLDKIGGIMLLLRAFLANSYVIPSDPKLYIFEGMPDSLRFDFAAVVPNQLEANLAQLHRLEQVLVGGGPVPEMVEKALSKYETQVWHSYASTETISHVALRSLNPEASQYYQALPGVRFKVSDSEELIIDAAHLGLVDLQTKDQVEMRDPFSFRWLGRSDNVVLSGGLKLYPEQIETGLDLSIPYFLDKQEDQRLGESLILVIREEDFKSTLIERVKQQLQGVQRPKAIYTLKNFEYTSNGKLRRKASRAKAKFKQQL